MHGGAGRAGPCLLYNGNTGAATQQGARVSVPITL